MSQACARCWRRKQKCDRRRPVCGPCAAVSAACIERRNGITIDPTDPTAHASYLEALKQRIHRLEAQLEQAGRKDGEAGDQPDSFENHATQMQSQMECLPLAAMAAFAGDQPTPMGSSASSVTALPSPPHPLSFKTFFRAAVRVSASNSSLSNTAITGTSSSFYRYLIDQEKQLLLGGLAAADAWHYVRMYLDTILSGLPYTDSTLVSDECTAFLQRPGEVGTSSGSGSSPVQDVQTPPAVPAAQAVRVYTAVATGILLSPSRRQMENMATALLLQTHQHMAKVVDDYSEAEIVQCMTSLVIASLLSPFAGSTWHLLGLTVMRCISAGMHHLDVSSAQSRDGSHLFWCIYILDTLVSSWQGRPFSIQNEDITTPLPRKDGEEKTFYSVIQVARVVRAIRRYPGKGALFHFANLRHCKDGTLTPISPFFNHLTCRLNCIALLELVSMIRTASASSASLTASAQTKIVLAHARGEFLRYLAILDEQTSDSAVNVWMGCDSVLVFCLGIELTCSSELSLQDGQEDMVVADKCLCLLTRLADIFNTSLSLRDTFGAISRLQQSSRTEGLTNMAGWDRLNDYMSKAMVEGIMTQRAHDLLQSAVSLSIVER